MLKVYTQEACLQHQFIRSKDTSNIVERPERLRAVNIGIATVLARTTNVSAKPVATPAPLATEARDADDLADAIGRLGIAQAGPPTLRTSAFHVIKSSAKVDVLNHAAVKYIHGDIEGDVYLEKLIKLARESKERIAAGESEIPYDLSQGDLYCKFE
jgi:histone deacetylase HOS3